MLDLKQFQSIADAFSVGTVLSSKQLLDFDLPLTAAKETGRFLVFSLKTTHGIYLLVGVSPSAILSDQQIKDILSTKLQAHYIQPIPTSFKSKLFISHRIGYHWQLFSPVELSQKAAQQLLSELKGKPIKVTIGYGAPILADIGYSDMLNMPQCRFYTDEYWWVEENGKQIAERWTVPKDFFDNHTTLFLEDVQFQNRLKRTKLLLSTGQTIIIQRAEELVTWYFDFCEQHYSLKLTGTGKLIQTDYTPQVYSAPQKKKTKTLQSVHTEFCERKKLSEKRAHQLLQPILNVPIQEITEDTGKSFNLEIGELIDKWRHQGLISVDSEWEFYRKQKKLATSTTHMFNYLAIVHKKMLKQALVSLPSKTETKLVFTQDYWFQLQPKARDFLGLVTFFNRKDDYHITFDGKNWEYTGPTKLVSN